MLHDDEGHTTVDRRVVEEFLNWLKPASGGTNANDKYILIRFVQPLDLLKFVKEFWQEKFGRKSLVGKYSLEVLAGAVEGVLHQSYMTSFSSFILQDRCIDFLFRWSEPSMLWWQCNNTHPEVIYFLDDIEKAAQFYWFDNITVRMKTITFENIFILIRRR